MKIKLTLIIFVITLVLLVHPILVACAKPPSTLPPPSAAPTTPSVAPSAPAPAPTPATGTEIGNLAPDFTLQYTDGKTFSLSGVQGKPVLLNFWTTWCSPCRSEMPLLQQIYEEYSSHNLVFVAIDIGENAAHVEKFLQDNELTIPVLLDTATKAANAYPFSGIPTTYFIDKDRIIRDRKFGAFSDKSEIEQSLKKIGL